MSDKPMTSREHVRKLIDFCYSDGMFENYPDAEHIVNQVFVPWRDEWLNQQLQPIIEVEQDWRRNFYTSFAKRLDKAIRKTQRKP